jgi:hypothetical protein
MVEITAPSLPLMDLGGDPRIVDGNADDLATVDMGVDEFPTLAVPSPLSVCAPDADSDGVADSSDPNDDNDLLTDVVESACGSNPLNGDVVPERIDTPGDDDRDSLVNEALPAGVHAYDCDGDGFVGVVEASVTTSDQDPCGGERLAVGPCFERGEREPAGPAGPGEFCSAGAAAGDVSGAPGLQPAVGPRAPGRRGSWDQCAGHGGAARGGERVAADVGGSEGVRADLPVAAVAIGRGTYES